MVLLSIDLSFLSKLVETKSSVPGYHELLSTDINNAASIPVRLYHSTATAPVMFMLVAADSWQRAYPLSVFWHYSTCPLLVENRPNTSWWTCSEISSMNIVQRLKSCITSELLRPASLPSPTQSHSKTVTHLILRLEDTTIWILLLTHLTSFCRIIIIWITSRISDIPLPRLRQAWFVGD